MVSTRPMQMWLYDVGLTNSVGKRKINARKKDKWLETKHSNRPSQHHGDDVSHICLLHFYWSSVGVICCRLPKSLRLFA